MHSLLFSLRRADLRSLAYQREILADFGITPARYLMLLAIAKEGNELGTTRWLLQCELGPKLGVTRMTVSVMVRSLERLGFVTRTEVMDGDRRSKMVTLTSTAWMLLRSVAAIYITPRIIAKTLYEAFDNRGEWIGALGHWADHFRWKFGEYADFLFHWQTAEPED